MKNILFLFLFFFFYQITFAQEHSEAGGMDLYKYGNGPNALISFHGKNGKYNDSATIVSDTEHGEGVDLTLFTLYALQLNDGDTDWGKNDISAVFAAVKEDGFTSVDITGLSLGGMAVIRAMSYNEDTTITNWPHLKIKTCGIVCGKDDRNDYNDFAKVKIRAWHDPDDGTMPYSNIEKMINATKEAGGEAELITLEGVGHNAWNLAYNKDADENYYTWLDSFYHGEVPPDQTEDEVKSFVVIDGVGLITTESGKKYNIELFPVSQTFYHQHHWFDRRWRRIWTIFNLEINIKGKDYKKATK